jgi:hypothetical protein
MDYLDYQSHGAFNSHTHPPFHLIGRKLQKSEAAKSGVKAFDSVFDKDYRRQG